MENKHPLELVRKSDDDTENLIDGETTAKTNQYDSIDDPQACTKCGALYSNLETLETHMEQCGKACDSESDSESDSDNESVWQDLLQDVYDNEDDVFQEHVQQYQALDLEDARKRAAEDMQPAYKRTLTKYFSKIFMYMQRFEPSKSYNKMLQDYTYNIKCKEYNKPKALRVAIRTNNKFFERLLEQDLEDSSDSSSEESNQSTDMETSGKDISDVD